MLAQNTEDNAELIKLSNRYENTLPSRIRGIFQGTNPLFVFAMKDMTDNTIKNLEKGRDMETIVAELGNEMNRYHEKIAQIKIFLNMRKSVAGVRWQEIKNSYNYQKLNGLQEFNFGRLRVGKSRYISKVNSGNYKEYLADLSHTFLRPKTYKGINLSFPNPEIYFLDYKIYHPSLFNGMNIKLYQVMQKDFDEIKPLINKSKEGHSLTFWERRKLDNNIADISYLFSNAMPFIRGSSAANLALVYGLYQMAGIEAAL